MAQTFDNGKVRITIDPKVLLEIAQRESGKRVMKAAEAVKRQVQRNISISTRAHGPSKPGEFPHADTGRLRNDVFWGMETAVDAMIGVRLDYGAILENFMQRSFLERTLREMRREVTRILTGR